MRIEDPQFRELYMKEAANNSWSSRFLSEQIEKRAIERLISSHKNKIEKQTKIMPKTKPADFIIRDPLLLDFLNLKENPANTENDLEQRIIGNIQRFMLELGKGFAFVSRQQRIDTEYSHFYIDLVFYNYILKCFVIVDLKTGKLSHQDIGQLDMYVRMYDDLRRDENDNPTIGIILCNDKDKAVVKYSVINNSDQLFVAKYKEYLPKEDDLAREIEQAKESLLLETEGLS
jgi:predicted nuclease of restriction endonuclease-like (RecB) superfamily